MKTIRESYARKGNVYKGRENVLEDQRDKVKV